MSSAVRCSLPLISRIHSCLFSNWRRTVSSKIFDAQVPSNFHRGTCAPSSRSLCSILSSLQRTQHSFKLFCVDDWQNRKSFLQRLWTLVPEHLSSHSATVQLRTLRRSRFGDSLSLRPLVQALGSCPASGAPVSFAIPPSFGRGRVTTTT